MNGLARQFEHAREDIVDTVRRMLDAYVFLLGGESVRGANEEAAITLWRRFLSLGAGASLVKTQRPCKRILLAATTGCFKSWAHDRRAISCHTRHMRLSSAKGPL